MSKTTSGPDELFDVVDLDDRVVDRSSRREVHARNLLHRAIHVLIHDIHGHLFLQRRSAAKDTFPGCWDSSCSGHVDAGEDYVTAARRELGEELGWHDASLPLRPLLKLRASPETGHEFIQTFLLGPLSGPFDLNPDEITAGRWITPDELDILIEEYPGHVAGALCLLWSRHRAEILAAIG
ncbi:MAG TPA: NUDIX domain-containing protein [Candidatus Methylacidiphilales bacterium]|jgi:isopentenyl-diphosphate delta-isomerase type 1|nr:NUDIX domain-containing protein [Candidatus Methylacidiphilales bacterium]